MQRGQLFAALWMVGLCVVLQPAGAFGQEKKTVTVHANRLLNDAKLFVQAGDVVSFSAQGEWTVKPKEEVFCGPDGEPGTSAPAGYQLPGAPVGALVAIVLGKRYLVGSKAEITFDQSGPVQFTVNTREKFSAYPGNKGTLTVQVEVKKTAAAGINGRYQISFKEDQVLVTTGNRTKVVPLEDLKKQKVETQSGGAVQLPDNTAETLKDLAGVIEVEVKKANVFIRDPAKPQQPPKKGLYNPNDQAFLVNLEGKFEQVIGSCYYTYAKTITGKLASGQTDRNLEGSINLTLSLVCAGSQGSQAKGKAVTVSLPFVGVRSP